MIYLSAKIRCPAYRAFIRSKPCCVCFHSPVEAAHIKARGLGSGKQNDFLAVPLCNRCHHEQHQVGIKTFQYVHRLNLWQIAAMYLVEFFADPERRMAVQVHVSEKS